MGEGIFDIYYSAMVEAASLKSQKQITGKSAEILKQTGENRE